MNTNREFIHEDEKYISSHKNFLTSTFLTNDEKIQKSKRTLSGNLYVVYYVYNMFTTDIQYFFASYKFRKVINKF